MRQEYKSVMRSHISFSPLLEICGEKQLLYTKSFSCTAAGLHNRNRSWYFVVSMCVQEKAGVMGLEATDALAFFWFFGCSCV